MGFSTRRLLIIGTFLVVGCKPFVATEAPPSDVSVSAAQAARVPVRGWADVKVYYRPPAMRYDEIGLLEASSANSWASSPQGKMDKVMERLRKRAVEMGANGILLIGVGTESGGSVSTSSATATSYGNQAHGSGLEVSIPVVHKSGSAIAIYVYEDGTGNEARERSVGVGDAEPTPAATHPTVQGTTSEKYDAILKLDDLRKRGLITDAEFEVEKRKVLAGH